MKKIYNTRAILASLLIVGFVGMFSETALSIAMGLKAVKQELTT